METKTIFFFSVIKLHILTWDSTKIDSFFKPAPSGHLKNYMFWHSCVKHIFQNLWLLFNHERECVDQDIFRDNSSFAWNVWIMCYSTFILGLDSKRVKNQL